MLTSTPSSNTADTTRAATAETDMASSRRARRTGKTPETHIRSPAIRTRLLLPPTLTGQHKLATHTVTRQPQLVTHTLVLLADMEHNNKVAMVSDQKQGDTTVLISLSWR